MTIGYLIARYLVEVLSLTPENALQTFSAARPGGIERQNYVADIQTRVPGEPSRPYHDHTHNQYPYPRDRTPSGGYAHPENGPQPWRQHPSPSALHLNPWAAAPTPRNPWNQPPPSQVPFLPLPPPPQSFGGYHQYPMYPPSDPYFPHGPSQAPPPQRLPHGFAPHFRDQRFSPYSQDGRRR